MLPRAEPRPRLTNSPCWVRGDRQPRAARGQLQSWPPHPSADLTKSWSDSPNRQKGGPVQPTLPPQPASNQRSPRAGLWANSPVHFWAEGLARLSRRTPQTRESPRACGPTGAIRVSTVQMPPTFPWPNTRHQCGSRLPTPTSWVPATCWGRAQAGVPGSCLSRLSYDTLGAGSVGARTFSASRSKS